MAIDLHTHTIASDGVCTPSQVVARALDIGLKAVAITDHDSVDGIPEALAAGEGRDIVVVPGVELSSDADGLDVHILGYFVDRRSERLRAKLQALRDSRRIRAERMVAALTEGGYPTTIEDVLAQAGEGAIGRAHVGRALIQLGYAANMREAFETFIGHGRPYYVRKPLDHPADVCRFLRDEGALPVIAHAAVSRAEELIPELVGAGLAGVEAYHSEHDFVAQSRLLQLAERHGLLVTGGSDFHGHAGGVELGSADVPDELLQPLLAAATGSSRPSA